MARWTRSPAHNMLGSVERDHFDVKLDGQRVGYVRKTWVGRWQWGTVEPHDFGQIDTLEAGLEKVREIVTKARTDPM